MSSSTLTPYYDSTHQRTFLAASSGPSGTKFLMSGREIACPYSVEVNRKITSAGSGSNDHVIVRITRTERNATTSKLATMSASIDISIPKDASIITPTLQREVITLLSSLLQDNTAAADTVVNITALCEGRDL